MFGDQGEKWWSFQIGNRRFSSSSTSTSTRTGIPPTVREIGQAVGLTSPSTVHAHLARLEAAGLIRRDPTKPRALEVIEGGRSRERVAVEVPSEDRRSTVLPLVGEVAAGGPTLAEETVEDHVAIPDQICANADFLLPSRARA